MTEAAPRRWTSAEFFASQETQPERYELVDGLPSRTIAGTTNAHDDIVVNVLAELRNQLRGGGCRPFTGDGRAGIQAVRQGPLAPARQSFHSGQPRHRKHGSHVNCHLIHRSAPRTLPCVL